MKPKNNMTSNEDSPKRVYSGKVADIFFDDKTGWWVTLRDGRHKYYLRFIERAAVYLANYIRTGDFLKIELPTTTSIVKNPRKILEHWSADNAPD